MKNPILAALFALLLASLACSAVSGGGTNGGTDGGSQSDNVLFRDDFSDSSSGWDTVRADEGITDYENGQYRIYVATSRKDVWANPGLSFTGDVRVEVDTSKLAGPDDNDFGLICRYQDTSNFYYGLISSDGYTAIGKVKDGEQNYISTEKMEPADAINKSADNHLRLDCVGSSLTLYANGQQIATANDPDFSVGDVGLMAGTFDTEGADIAFDDFLVTKP